MSSSGRGDSGYVSGGFSYVEILVAMSLIVVALIPAMNALRVGVTATTVHETRVVNHYEMVGRMEQVLAEPFGLLSTAAGVAGDEKTPTSYSDPSGSDPRILVFLGRYDLDNADADGDPFTGADAGVLWVRVAVEGTLQSFETLVSSS
jgi:hypothetical protein